jgi:hypothetical protein
MILDNKRLSNKLLIISIIKINLLITYFTMSWTHSLCSISNPWFDFYTYDLGIKFQYVYN